MTTTLKDFRSGVMEEEAIGNAHRAWGKNTKEDRIDGLFVYAVLGMARAAIQLGELASEVQPEMKQIHRLCQKAVRNFSLAYGCLDREAIWPKPEMAGSLPGVSLSKMSMACNNLLGIVFTDFFDNESGDTTIRRLSVYNYGLALIDYLHSWGFTIDWAIGPFKADDSEPMKTQIYVYEKVPKEVYDAFASSESKGSYFHKNIRPKFGFHTIRA